MGRQPWVVFGLLTTERRRVAGRQHGGGAHRWSASRCCTASWRRESRLLMISCSSARDRPRGRAGRPTRDDRPAAGVHLLRLDGRLHGPSRPSGSCLIAVLWLGYFVLEGFDFGVGMLLPVLAHADARAPGDDQHDRTGLGRQRGLADRRRRRDVRGLPAVVRHALLGLLPGAVPDPRRADRARCRVRVLRQARRRRWRAGWDVALVLGTLCPRCCGVWRWRTSCAACRSTPRASSRARFFDLLGPYALLGGLATLQLFLAHGAIFLALKTNGEVRRRASALARAARLVAAASAVVFLALTLVNRATAAAWRSASALSCGLAAALLATALPAARAARFAATSGAIVLRSPGCSSACSRTRWCRPPTRRLDLTTMNAASTPTTR